MAAVPLTDGALLNIMQEKDCADVQPIIQVLSIKKMNTGSGHPDKDRYRLNVSDGTTSLSYAMMTGPVFFKAGEKGIPKYTIIKLIRYITSVVNNTGGVNSRVLLIMDMKVIQDGDEVGIKIGDPVPYSENQIVSKANVPQKPAASSNSSSNTVSNNQDVERPAKVPRLMPSASAASSSNSNGTANNLGPLATHITHPIASLSPYHNKWVVKAKVINKSDIKKWENARGSGQLFNVEFADESGDIRCTAFRDQVDKFFNLLEVDKVYYISKCQVKPANKQFNPSKNHYEMAMTADTIIQECTDDKMSNLETKYEFVPIVKLGDLETGKLVDVLGIVSSVGELLEFSAKSTGRALKKRDIQLLDESTSTINLTLWGSQAENFVATDHPVIALKGAKINEFGGGKSLGTGLGTIMKVNPDLKECFALKGWYEREGMNITASDLSARNNTSSFNVPWMTFREVQDQQFGTIDPVKGDYYKVKATVLLIRVEKSIYKACIGCNKKVIDNGDNTYRCEKCKTSDTNFKYRLLCGMNLGDWTGNQWVSMFSDEAEKVLGMTAQEAGELFETESLHYEEAVQKCHFKELIFTCRVKMEQYNDEARLKTVAVRVEPINYSDYMSHLVSDIKKYVL
ncbi:replication protein A 70 kDa DNA-binding subunit [Euwallacea similis]|uniref:replication protein A 70 kDa DNA-binding subunit n=1 Tax=Euwallacea similis TaxID=1736056 RepID=UPI003450D669